MTRLSGSLKLKLSIGLLLKNIIPSKSGGNVQVIVNSNTAKAHRLNRLISTWVTTQLFYRHWSHPIRSREATPENRKFVASYIALAVKGTLCTSCKKILYILRSIISHSSTCVGYAVAFPHFVSYKEVKLDYLSVKPSASLDIVMQLAS